MASVRQLLSNQGGLAEHVPRFVERESQLAFAECVVDAIETREHALLEAGTGTGKTLGYLAAIIASGKKAIISTGTKTLQDQLNQHDLPILGNVSRHQCAVLKGRANYVCPERLRTSLKLSSHDYTQDKLVRVREWWSQTRTGDLGELPDLDDWITGQVTSTRDNCLGSQCPSYDSCPVYRARHKAMGADLVIVNHHLLFADLTLKGEGLGELLPGVDVIVLDEAHQVPDVARQFFGERFGSGQIVDLVNDVMRESSLLGNDDPELLYAARDLATAAADFVTVVGQSANNGQWMKGREVEAVDYALEDLIQRLQIAGPRSRGLDLCYRRAHLLSDLFALVSEPVESDRLHWVQLTNSGFVIHLSAVDLANDMSALIEESGVNWIFVSATLRINGSFEHFQQELGLSDTSGRTFESPYNLRERVQAWIPAGLPEPPDASHTSALVRAMLPLLKFKSLLLFTSYRAMNAAREQLVEDHDVFFQGQMPRTELLAQFHRAQNAILLATHSYWEGLDLKGAGVRVVMVDKLPFSSPDDPLTNAILSRFKNEGRDGFNLYLLPRAIITLRQGFGRLIRQESDHGVFVLGDPRVCHRGYGGAVLGSLPIEHWHREIADVINFLDSHEPACH